MATTRRAFLQASAVGALSAAAAATQASEEETAVAGVEKASKSLDLLILGGTGFLGPHVVEYALARGHKMTLFNRGRSNTHLFPNLEKLVGDRHDDIEALKDRKWDAVVDTTAYVPRHVTATAELLRDNIKQYILISTLSVYADQSVPYQTEDGAVIELDQETLDSVQTIRESIPHYGGMKAHCEKAAEAAMPGRTCVIRPGLIVGPRDNSRRFTYWPVRIERGGEILAPGDGNDLVQFIDVRDLAEFTVKMIEDGNMNTFNAIGPAHPLKMLGMLYGIKAITTGDAHFTWADADFLAEHQVAAWMDMPVWIPARDGYEGFHYRDNQRGIAAGMRFRPLADTAQATLDWYHAQPEEERERYMGRFTAEREKEVLAAWHARDTAPQTTEAVESTEESS
jgi:nucleoside-diphosphate-sugar epimerase